MMSRTNSLAVRSTRRTPGRRGSLSLLVTPPLIVLLVTAGCAKKPLADPGRTDFRGAVTTPVVVPVELRLSDGIYNKDAATKDFKSAQWILDNRSTRQLRQGPVADGIRFVPAQDAGEYWLSLDVDKYRSVPLDDSDGPHRPSLPCNANATQCIHFVIDADGVVRLPAKDFQRTDRFWFLMGPGYSHDSDSPPINGLPEDDSMGSPVTR